MKWYHYGLAFLAGVLLANAIPHFINGISGNAFPTPFANPPGKGFSSPVMNTIWALFNIVVGFLLLRISRISKGNKRGLIVFLAGMVLISLALSAGFADKLK